MKSLNRAAVAVLLIAIALLLPAGALLWLHLASPSDGARLPSGGPAWQAGGVVVVPLEVRPDGLQSGDVVVAVEGRSMEAWGRTSFDFDTPPADWKFGQTVTYTILRDGHTYRLPITLGSYPLLPILAEDWGAVLSAVAFLLVMAFVFFKRPDETAARVLFLGSASMVSATAWSFGLQIADLTGKTGFWLYAVTTVGAYLLVWISALHVALIFPTRWPPLQRRRWIVTLMYAAPYALLAIYALVVWSNTATVLDWLNRLGRMIGVLQLVCVLLAMVAAVRGYRAARDPVSRLQVRWIVAAFLVVFLCAAVFGMIPELALGSPLLSWSVLALVGLLVPLAFAVAILRYRLFDIDVLINRTLVYGVLTAIIVAFYVLVVGSLSAVFQSRGTLLISLVATGLVAVFFQPVRDRLQHSVNRLMYGERDDPYAVLSRLGQRLEATLAPEAVLPAIVESIAQTLRLPYAAIALKNNDQFEIAAAYGLPPSNLTPLSPSPVGTARQERGQGGEVLRLPLMYQAEAVGQLLVAPRAPGEAFSPAEERLLEDIAHQAGVAAHAVRLTADLQHSRERLVTAREEERRRLRRDLHDGLGPALASLTLKLDAARNLLARDRAATETLLLELKTQTQSAIADIRRLVYDLRPPALDELGLVPAIREHAARNVSANGLRVLVEAPESLPPLPAAVEVAAYRITMEALTNVARHAQAHTCVVRLSLPEAGGRPQGSPLQIEIVDDGVGLPADQRAGVGLTSMRERAAELGGTCAVGPGPGGGTRVVARLPIIQEA